MKIDISIILPVYNGAKHLRKALKGIAQQDFEDFEVLIINDGSTDNTPQIAREFCQQDRRFKLYYKENGGVASARNLGLDKASGTYIIHHDADDLYPDSDILSALHHSALKTNTGIIMGDYKIKTKIRTTRISQEFNGNADELIQGLLDNHYHAALWNKLIRRNFYENLRFVEGINYMEDKLFLIRLLYKNPQIHYLPKITYTYYIKDLSSYQLREADINSVKQVIETLENDFKQNKRPYDLTRQKLKYKLTIILNKKNIDHTEVFKEVNPLIFKTKGLVRRYKILLFFEAIGIRSISKFYKFLSKLKKKVK